MLCEQQKDVIAGFLPVPVSSLANQVLLRVKIFSGCSGIWLFGTYLMERSPIMGENS
jgi:hypothetical protein